MYPASPGTKRTSIGELPRTNQPRAMPSCVPGYRFQEAAAHEAAGAVGADDEVEALARPAAVRSSPDPWTSTTRSEACRAPAPVARRSSQRSSSRREATATGFASESSSHSPSPDSKRQLRTKRAGSGSSGRRLGQERERLAGEAAAARLLARVRGSKTVTEAPSRASRYASSDPAGPAPTTATFTRRPRSSSDPAILSDGGGAPAR